MSTTVTIGRTVSQLLEYLIPVEMDREIFKAALKLYSLEHKFNSAVWEPALTILSRYSDSPIAGRITPSRGSGEEKTKMMLDYIIFINLKETDKFMKPIQIDNFEHDVELLDSLTFFTDERTGFPS